MKKISTQRRAIFAASFLILFAASCNNEAKKDEPATVTTSVSTDKTTVTNPDSTTTITKSTTTITGKPNPAKKGGKGKTVIVMTASSGTNKTMPMEMDNAGIYNRADVMPSFPGGEKALIKYLEENIQYPQAAIDDGVEGNVQLQFAVDENGKVYSPTLLSEKIGYGLEEETMRVINKMPRWTPGNIKGKNVKTRFTLPVSFVIN